LVEQMGNCEPPHEDLKYDDEILVMEIYENQRQKKELKRKIKNKVLFINDKNKCLQISWKGLKQVTQKHIDAVKKGHPREVILNELPLDKALELYLKAV